MTDTIEANSWPLKDAFALIRKHGVMQITEFPSDLIEALGISPAASLAAMREYARSRLLAAADQVKSRKGSEWGMAFKIVGGLLDGCPADQRGRLRMAEAKLRISGRTALRHFEHAARQIPAILHGIRDRPVREEADYAFLHARTRIDLRSETPYIVNERTISARSDWIDHIDEFLVFPGFTGDALPIRALEGCHVEDITKAERGAWSFKLVFPRTLRVGDHHSFATSIQLPTQDALTPIAAFLPRTTSYDAALELRFGDQRPAKLERFVAPPLAEVLDSELFEPVNSRHDFVFRQMHPGFIHGARWRWDEGALPSL